MTTSFLDMKEQGRPTVVMTTHDKDQAHRLADNLLRIKDGKISS
jgi:ABC-type proline/glycine betaine transport system ATPase subunit